MNTPALQNVLNRFPQRRQTGENQWSVRCPAHDDHNPSASVSVGDDGRVLLKCFKGCSIDQIVAALGLSKKDLFVQNPDVVLSKPQARASKTIHQTLEDALRCLCKKIGQPTHVYRYHSAVGTEVGAVVRFDPPGEQKQFFQLHRKDDGWRFGAMPRPRPLYRLPELATASLIFITEGEKCADAALTLGFTATTSGGATSVASADWSPLIGKTGVILRDNDEPGIKFRDQLTKRLQAQGTTVVSVDLPGLPPAGDIVDWMATRKGTSDDKRFEIMTMIESARHMAGPTGVSSGLILQRLDDLEVKPINWLWPGRIPRGRLTMVVGLPGRGKSFLTLDLAARVSTGTAFPDGAVCPRGTVLLASAEDDDADTVKPRLMACAADVSRVYSISGIMTEATDGPKSRQVGSEVHRNHRSAR